MKRIPDELKRFDPGTPGEGDEQPEENAGGDGADAPGAGEGSEDE